MVSLSPWYSSSLQTKTDCRHSQMQDCRLQSGNVARKEPDAVAAAHQILAWWGQVDHSHGRKCNIVQRIQGLQLVGLAAVKDCAPNSESGHWTLHGWGGCCWHAHGVGSCGCLTACRKDRMRATVCSTSSCPPSWACSHGTQWQRVPERRVGMQAVGSTLCRLLKVETTVSRSWMRA